MHRQYLRFFQHPKFVRILQNNQCLSLNNIRRLHVYQKQLNLPGALSFQTGPSFSNLFGHPIFSLKNNLKYLSQKNITPDPVDSLNENSTSNSSQPSIVHNGVQEEPDRVSKNSDHLDLFEDINYDEITEGDEEKLNKFKLLMLEIDVLRQDGMYVPSNMSTEEWKELFSMESRNQKKKFLIYLFKNEMKNLGDKRRKELKKLARLEERPFEENQDSNEMKYGFRGSTIFIRIYDTTINLHDNYRLIRAMMFGQDLVIDCGFYNDMNSMENKLCCKQLVYLFAENRMSKEPFNLHFCNLKKDSILYSQLKKCIPTIEDPTFPINIYEEHYLDIFPKQKFVYLTPHCRTELREYNHDDIYIIGK